MHDYRLDDAGISNFEDDDEDEERKVKRGCIIISFNQDHQTHFSSIIFLPAHQVQWDSWMKSAKSVVITPETNYADIIVPTADTVRMSFLMDMLLANKKPVSTLIVVELHTSVCKHFCLKLMLKKIKTV